MKSEKVQSIDGNEDLKKIKNNTKVKGKWNNAIIGNINLKKGQQVITLRSGKEYVFVPTMEEFKKKDRKYRGLNIELSQITLKKAMQ